MKIGKYETNILKRLAWYFGDRKHPKSAWYYPIDNWITDPKEVERIIRENGLEI